VVAAAAAGAAAGACERAAAAAGRCVLGVDFHRRWALVRLPDQAPVAAASGQALVAAWLGRAAAVEAFLRAAFDRAVVAAALLRAESDPAAAAAGGLLRVAFDLAPAEAVFRAVLAISAAACRPVI
jgi:hypothetical protein